MLVFGVEFGHFVDEPGKQVRSAIGIKNTSKSHAAFKVWKMFLQFSPVFDVDAWLVLHMAFWLLVEDILQVTYGSKYPLTVYDKMKLCK